MENNINTIWKKTWLMRLNNYFFLQTNWTYILLFSGLTMNVSSNCPFSRPQLNQWPCHPAQQIPEVFSGGRNHPIWRLRICFKGVGSTTTYYPPWNEQLAPENGWLEYYFPFGSLPIFRGYVSFREGIVEGNSRDSQWRGNCSHPYISRIPTSIMACTWFRMGPGLWVGPAY